MTHHSRLFALVLSICIAAIATIMYVAFAGDVQRIGRWLFFFFLMLLFAFGLLYLAMRRLMRLELKEIIRQLRMRGVFRDAGEDATFRDYPISEVAQRITAFIDENKIEVDRLKKLEAFRKEFIADVSHELKTPIFAAQGFIHTLLDGAVKEKAVRKKFLKKAAKSLDGLDVLVQDLLTLSQIETGQIKMQFKELDLYALTMEVFEQFKGRLTKKDISLRIDGPFRKVLVYADGQRIGQVMTNLVSNAINHSSKGDEVIVNFTVRKKTVVTSVKDFGEGIAAENINRIFERFYRIDKSRSREKGGTGLGLSIVKHILEGHNSKAKVVSEPGKGSTFSFKLPRASKDENGPKHEPAENEAFKA